MITTKEWKFINSVMQDVLDKLRIESPNTCNMLEFDIDGWWAITDCYGKTIKRYKKFQNAINYLLLND